MACAVALHPEREAPVMLVRCAGTWRGRRCNKILAHNLAGTVDLKCGRCQTAIRYDERDLEPLKKEVDS
jgi:hypothetical protein